MSIPQETIDLIKERLSIVDLIGETVQLTGMGRGIYRFAKRLKLIRDSK